ncbi:Vms1/Ankzf1 family peptidyl-tRNA hydrolase [Saliphagus infecundisoli]|uniref:Vms1/Ankzf1 family peptidyl-tRNA hydrolase n=1 Tax=Saliphagus infecundisoli TaxID=1849069 RepID=A0ABD5QIL8_9EURY|nr:Vms1/Ankzf1 family peptidyl-tRNA hydrolase [Saliphagus infecundisoli]
MSSSTTDIAERIERVASIEADDDHLFTLAVAADEPIAQGHERLEPDRATADYVDPQRASKPIRQALERARERLEEYDTIPENGLVIYAGVVESEVVDFVFDDLPTPVETGTVAQDNEFVTAPLESGSGASADLDGEFGLLVVERGGVALGRLSDDEVTVVAEYDSEVSERASTSGYAEGSYEREDDRQAEAFYDRVAEDAAEAFLADSAATGASPAAAERTGDGDGAAVAGLLVGGTSHSAEQFLADDRLDYRLEEALVADPIPVEDASENGLEQLADRGREEIEAASRERVAEALDRFYSGVETDEPVASGPEEVDRALEFEAVETLLVTGELSVERRHGFERRVAETGGESIAVPEDVEGGQRLAEEFDGVAALLRYPID